MFCKNSVLKNFTKSSGKHLCQNRFFNKVAGVRQVFSCEFYEIFKNTFFYRTPLVVASVDKKLNDYKLQPKAYWHILKTLCNGKKVPLVPPHLVNQKSVTDNRVKPNVFTKFFYQQCTSLLNSIKFATQ